MIVINIKIVWPIAPEILQLLYKYLILNVILEKWDYTHKIGSFFFFR